MSACGVNRLASNLRLDSASEQALVEQCRRRDFDAFGRVVDAYQARVLGFVRRMCANTEEALDITQEVFIRAYQHLDRFDGRCSLRSWLFKIAYNLCVDRSRRRDRLPAETRIDQAAEEGEAYEICDNRWNPETMALDAELVEVVEAGLMSMSEKLPVRTCRAMSESTGRAGHHDDG
jgi:RNA polymerase sigma-70 factor (ECF subfamily)